MARMLTALRVHVESIRPYLPPLNFITIHYLYFIGINLFTSIIFYVSSTPAWSISYVDSLFLVISAMTEAGLNTVNLSAMNTFQQWMLWMHIMAGSAIFVSISVLHIRKKAFEKRFGALLKSQRERMRKRRKTFSDSRGHFRSRSQILPQENPGRRDVDEEAVESTPDLHRVTESSTLRASPSTPASSTQNKPEPLPLSPDRITFAPAASQNNPSQLPHRRRGSQVFSFSGVGAAPVATSSFRRPGQGPLFSRRVRTDSSGEGQPRPTDKWPKFLTGGVIGRNSQFHGLTSEEREQLGGAEYRAITLLSWIVPIYFIAWQLVGSLGLGAWMAYHASDLTRANGINPWWNGAFNAISAFNNSGMSLLDANMIPFQQSVYPVVTMGLLILAGNTAYPVFLRLILWTIYRLIPSDNPYYSDWKDTLKFALDHPRRVYTHLFPSTPSWWLLLSLIALNGIDWVAFELLNLGNDALEHIPWNYKVMDGLFQALAVRSGGFYIVPIPSLRIGVQVLYVIMMYISVYPVVITMRNSNVYEERSLGIYSEEQGTDTVPEKNESGLVSTLKRHLTFQTTPEGENRAYFVKQQVRGQLAHDLSWLFVAVLLIVCIETGSFERDPITYSVFNVTFEVTSGYGCVGITTGLPDQAYSFSGGWHKVSKLILCAVMLRGRHRGLPVAIDRAVLLPGDGLAAKEEEDHEKRKRKSAEGFV